jgi:hypothetical protein
VTTAFIDLDAGAVRRGVTWAIGMCEVVRRTVSLFEISAILRGLLVVLAVDHTIKCNIAGGLVEWTR